MTTVAIIIVTVSVPIAFILFIVGELKKKYESEGK